LDKNKYRQEIRNEIKTTEKKEIKMSVKEKERKDKKIIIPEPEPETTEEKQEIKKEEIIENPEKAGEVGEKIEVSEKNQVKIKKEITEERLKKELENINTKKDLLDYLESFDVLKVKIKNGNRKGLITDWLFNSPFFDELKKYLKGEINKLDDGYRQNIPLIIRNKVKDIFAAEEKERNSKEKNESGKEKSVEEQLFEQDMKTLKDIALRMTMELHSRLEKENAEYRNKEKKEKDAFLQGALRGFLQKVMKKYDLSPEESKERASQIIEGIISS